MAWYKPTPDETRDNWRAVKRMGRLYRLAVVLPLLALALAIVWGSGYAQGLLAACSVSPARSETISKETNNVR